MQLDGPVSVGAPFQVHRGIVLRSGISHIRASEKPMIILISCHPLMKLPLQYHNGYLKIAFNFILFLHLQILHGHPGIYVEHICSLFPINLVV